MADVTITQITVGHALAATTPDDPAYEIRPSHWNSAHLATFVLAASAVVGLFSNANGMSFGTSDGAITGSYTQSTHDHPFRASNDGVGLNTAQTNVTWTVNSAGISLNAGGYAGTGFTSATTEGTEIKATLATNGLSMAVPAYLTAAAGGGITNIKVSAGTLSQHRSDITFNNANGVSFGLETNGIITASHNGLTSQSNQAVSAANGSYAFQTLSFSNANGISFGTSAGSAITASHNALTTARASNDAIGLNTAQSNVTWTVNSAGLSLDARGYAGTGTTFGGTNVSASITLNSNGLQLSLSAPAGGGGGGFTKSRLWPWNEAQLVSGQQGQATHHIAPVQVDADVHLNRVLFPLIYSNATNSTGSVTISMWFGIYTKNASTLSLLHSMSTTQGFTHSGTVRNSLMSGIRNMSMPWTTTITAGEYWVGIGSRTTSGGGNATINQLLVSQFTNATQGAYSGILGAASATSDQWPIGFGVYTATSAAVPVSVPFSQIRGTGTLDARPPSWWMTNGTV